METSYLNGIQIFGRAAGGTMVASSLLENGKNKMIFKPFFLSGLFMLGCAGVLHASDDTKIDRTDSTELATKAWAALQSSDHKKVQKLTMQCFKEFGDEAMKQQKASGEEKKEVRQHLRN